MSITTHRGDDGQTDLMFGDRVPKSHPRIETLGAIDELNAALGLARAGLTPCPAQQQISALQGDLIVVMGELATLTTNHDRYVEAGHRLVDEKMVSSITDTIRQLEGDHEIRFHGWAVPGSSPGQITAQLDFARTVGRRAERGVAGLLEAEEISNLNLLRYLNRVSDLLWVLARVDELK